MSRWMEVRQTRWEMELSDKVDDIVQKIPISDQDVYVTSGGRLLRRSDKLESCEVRDGSTGRARAHGDEQCGNERKNDGGDDDGGDECDVGSRK